jgi:glycosyltransferase involved in cell wall biosynthesis
MQIGMANSRRLVAAVDLLPLRPGGENGGIKPAIFALLRAARTEAQSKLVFVFLTNSASHRQVRELAAPGDILICALEDPAHPCSELDAGLANEFKIIPPPPDLVRSIDVDLLYCPFGATTFHAPGVPTIALIADLLHKDFPFTLTPPQIAERESYIQSTIRVATRLQCISRSGMERMIEHYRVPRATLFYTYLPIHIRLDQASAELDVPAEPASKRPFFFYPANLWLHKNHELLLLSFARYCHEAEDEGWDLVLTFHEDDRAGHLRSLAHTLGISERVRFAGFVTEPELRRIWQSAGALVFPSLHEGFGIPLLEAMHYGVPIISGSDFSLREVAGDACYRIDPRKPASVTQALFEVSGNSELRAALIKRGRERLALFDLKIAATSLLDAFSDVTRNEYDFPRKSKYSREPSLTAPTPASAERWEIELDFDEPASSTKFSVYLNDMFFGSFKPAIFGEKGFSFFCRPEGRTLALRPFAEKTLRVATNGGLAEIPVKRIVAKGTDSRQVLLYEKRNRQSA